jgi:hypothetical protein
MVIKKISAARIPWIMQLHNFSWTYSTSKVYERYAISEGDKPFFLENGTLKDLMLLKCSQLFVWVINVCIRVHKNFFKEMLESFCYLCNAKQKGNLRNHKFWIPMFTISLERHKNNSKFEAPLPSLPNGQHGSSVTQLNP